MFLNLNKGDKVKYLGNMRYTLANGQIVKEGDEEIMIQSNVRVQKKFFSLIEDNKEKKVENVEKPAPQVDTDGELDNKKDKEKKEIEEKKEQPKKRAGRPAKK